MSRLPDLLRSGRPVIAEFSIFELLRRDPTIEFDPFIAHAGLIYEQSARAALERVHRRYLAIAAGADLPLLMFADTWRASAERVAKSRFRGHAVNADNVAFIRSIAADAAVPAIAGAYIGPRGDAYKPEEAPSRDDAKRYHEPQIAELASAGVDAIVAATLPSFDEALGIAEVLSGSGVDWMTSFVVRPSGHLLDGTPLSEAIRTIDESVAVPPVGYAINCVHPTVALRALEVLPQALRERVLLFQGNASDLSPEELDGAAEIVTSEPEAFADDVDALRRVCPLAIIGGCCGTDESHMNSVARRVAG